MEWKIVNSQRGAGRLKTVIQNWNLKSNCHFRFANAHCSVGLDGEHLITEAGEIMGIPLTFDEKTRRAIIIDKSMGHEYLIELPANGSMLYIYTVLAKLGAERENAPFLRSLLELNLFGLQTSAATIGVDGRAATVVMHIAFPAELLAPQLLVNLLRNFIASAKKTRDKIGNLLITTNRELRRQNTRFSAVDAMSKGKPKSDMRIIRI
jgi:hypothetical protein